MENLNSEIEKFIHDQMLIDKANKLLKKSGYTKTGECFHNFTSKQHLFDGGILRTAVPLEILALQENGRACL
jgi:hypothetical protein